MRRAQQVLRYGVSPVPAARLFGGSTLEENSFAFPPDPGAARARLRILLECAIADYR